MRLRNVKSLRGRLRARAADLHVSADLLAPRPLAPEWSFCLSRQYLQAQVLPSGPRLAIRAGRSATWATSVRIAITGPVTLAAMMIDLILLESLVSVAIEAKAPGANDHPERA
jgi:hypothetical protein